MNYGRMLGQYERTSVESASKVELVVLVLRKGDSVPGPGPALL